MLELPEVLTLSRQLRENVAGRRVARVLPPTKPHKFCWFSGEPAAYHDALAGACVEDAEGFGIFAELRFNNGRRLCLNDGVNLRLAPPEEPPKAYQLLIELDDGRALVFTVAMYGGIYLHTGGFENEYYLKSRAAVSPLDEGFADVFAETLENSKPGLSAKAFLATEQRFPGLGNGVLQDILFNSNIHPKRKMNTLSPGEKETLLHSVKTVLGDMAGQGGRDTEKDLFAQPGGYRTKMSKNTLAQGCPSCGGPITKEAYLGGAVYYCPSCQPL